MRTFALILLLGLSACATDAVKDPTVGGAQMFPSRTMLENLSASGDHDTFVAAVKTAGLDGVLSGPGPFTVFAPTDAAFAALPADQRIALLDDKGRLSHLIDCNTVTGLTTVAQLTELAAQNGGTYPLKTMGGCTLTATVAATGGVILTDDAGTTGHITTGDISQENGVVHVVDTVFLPAG